MEPTNSIQERIIRFMETPKQFLTVQQLAAFLGVTPGTIRVWTRKNGLPKLRLARKAVRYDYDAVMEWIRNGQAAPVLKEDKKCQKKQ